MTFEEKMDRIGEIIELIKENKLDLEESCKLYEEAKILAKEIEEELKKAEEKIVA